MNAEPYFQKEYAGRIDSPFDVWAVAEDVLAAVRSSFEPSWSVSQQFSATMSDNVTFEGTSLQDVRAAVEGHGGDLDVVRIDHIMWHGEASHLFTTANARIWPRVGHTSNVDISSAGDTRGESERIVIRSVGALRKSRKKTWRSLVGDIGVTKTSSRVQVDRPVKVPIVNPPPETAIAYLVGTDLDSLGDKGKPAPKSDREQREWWARPGGIIAIALGTTVVGGVLVGVILKVVGVV
jgi:hypothetical protein